MAGTSEYEALARESGAFEDIEIEILNESIESWRKKPGAPFKLLEIRDGKILAAFLLFSRDEGTDYTFSVQAVGIDPAYLETEVMQKLLDDLETSCKDEVGSPIIRFELSSKKLEAMGRGILDQRGYGLIGHIPNFYAKGVDYFMFAKLIQTRAQEA